MNVGRYLRGEDRHVGTARVKQPHADAILQNKAAQRLLPRERDIERYLVKRAKALGGEVRKVQWVGRRSAPDRLVMLPDERARDRLAYLAAWVRSGNSIDLGAVADIAGRMTIWIELKSPGVKPETHQLREHARMRALGQRVEVIDSFEAVDRLLG